MDDTLNKNVQKNINDVQQLIEQLRDPKTGCPWDLKQDFHSLLKCTIEETYEVVDAINNEDWPHVVEELGDLLLQILFYTQLAREQGLFNLTDITTALHQKLIRRHPHVFGSIKADNASQALAHWEVIKAQEKILNRKDSMPQLSILDDIPHAFPALLRADKIQKRCAKHGFDWHDIQTVINKVSEELQEVQEEVHIDQDNESNPKIEEELGDLLFAVVNLTRHLKCDPEQALRKANHKFENRFRKVEQLVTQQNKQLVDFDLTALDKLWDQVKLAEKIT